MNEQPQNDSKKKRKNPFSDSTEPKRLKTDSDSDVKNDCLVFMDEKMEENIVNYLPNEILIQIFKILAPADLAKAGVVCRSWHECRKDESLGWYSLSKKNFVETTRYYKYSKLKAPGQYKTLEEARKANELDLEQFDGVLKFLGSAESAGGSYYLIKCNSKIRLVHNLRKKVMYDDWHSNCYRYTVSCDEQEKYGELSVTLNIELNLRRVEKRVRNGEEIGQQEDLLRSAAILFRKAQKNANHDYLQQRFDPLLSYTPQVNSIVTATHERMIGVELHDYQLCAINFMVSVEQERKTLTFSPLMSIPMTYLLANPLIKNNCLILPEDASKHDMTFTVKGGVLADEMGLGKSIEVLGLILERPMVQKPNENRLFVTKATLICCPNHLAQQWQNEIEKHTEPKLSVITITTIHHVKKYTPQDVMNADVVIATYNLLQNPNYLKFPNGNNDGKLDVDEDVYIRNQSVRYERLDALLEENRKKKNAEKVKGVILEHYLWHRIVLDEGHEVVKEKWFKMMHKFKATHKWLVSGTPFPRNDDIHRVRSWLDIAIARGNDLPEEYHSISRDGANYNPGFGLPYNLLPIEEDLANLFIKELLWRNTKKSVKQEYEMVDVDEEIKKIVVSPIENAIYKHFWYPSEPKELRAACCTMDSAWGKTNEERRQHFIKLRKAMIKSATTELDDWENKNEFYTAKLAKRAKEDPTNTAGLGAANDFIKAYPQRKKILTDRLDQHRKVLKLFEQLEFEDDNEEGHTTKLRELVSYLKDLFERDNKSRVIIFSQYHNFLEQIGRELTENDILTTNLKGNVYQKTKGLNKFKTDKSEVKVMLMSFKNTASGTNLIEANHVIFMEPLSKSDTEVKAIESQAIGRAQRQGQTRRVKLVRFLVDDSIETTMHAKYNATMKSKK